MQYIWIFLPILGYIAILILSFFRYRNLVLTEAKLFVWYLALGLLAAVYAYDRHTSEMFNDFLIDGRRPNIDQAGIIDTSVAVLWPTYVLSYLTAFAVLSSVRLIILFFVEYKRRKSNQT